MTDLPRLLCLTSEAPHTAAAGAILLHRLFTGYPSDRLLVVTSSLPPPSATRLPCRYEHLPLKVDRLNRTRFWSWRAVMRALGGTRLLDLDRVDRVLGGFQPDIIVTLMQDCWYYDFAARYARSRGKPLALFIHDLPDGFEPVPAWLRCRQHACDEAVYRQAACRLCISEPMRTHFAQVFGTSGEVLLPPRSDEPVSQSPEACVRLKQAGHLTLGYAGGLHYGYGEQLLRLLPAFRATGTRVELFSPRPGGTLAALNDATDILHFNGYVSPPAEAWRRLLACSDVVLQPYLNPPAIHARQYRTHFPSKLAEYLSLGLPVLVTGPANASGVSWCLGHPGCAQVVTDPSTEAMVAALNRLRMDNGLRVSLAREAQAAAIAFDAPRLRAHLHTSLTHAATAR